MLRMHLQANGVFRFASIPLNKPYNTSLCNPLNEPPLKSLGARRGRERFSFVGHVGFAVPGEDGLKSRPPNYKKLPMIKTFNTVPRYVWEAKLI